MNVMNGPRQEHLTDLEKNQFVEKHKGIIIHMANKYKWLDPNEDFDEVQSVCYLGLAEAINKYGYVDDLGGNAFKEIRKKLYQTYRKKDKPLSEVSLEKPALSNKDGDELSVEDLIPCENNMIDSIDINQIISEALFEERPVDKKMIIDHLIFDKSNRQIANENSIPEYKVRKTVGKGITLIKTYLINNDIISAYLLNPIETPRKKKTNVQLEPIPENDYSKIKHIRKFYPFLGYSDIATLIGSNSYTVATLLDYPTVKYLQISGQVIDPDFEKKILQYCHNRYPNHLPGEVKRYNVVAIGE